MKNFKYTNYFINEVLRKRPYIKKEWCCKIVSKPIKTNIQTNGRIQFWGYVEEINKYLRIVTLEDQITIHNAFPDRNFKRRFKR